MQIKRITVIGCGRWGSFIAKHLSDLGFAVTLYGRATSPKMVALLQNRESSLMKLPDNVTLCCDLKAALQNTDLTVISIGAQGLRTLAGEMRAAGFSGKAVLLCMKGLEIGTGKRLSTVIREELGAHVNVAVWLGPGHVQDFCNGIPNCMVIDSDNSDLKHLLVNTLASPLIRFYYGQDLIGNEIGAAAKNVIGIAAGMLDGLGLSPLKGALMSRGTHEIARLIEALGGCELSAYGLCHLGDYEATVFSPHSHNRGFGEAFVKGQPFTDLAEGYYTVQALVTLADATGIDLPICRTVQAVLYQNASAKESLYALFARSLKNEF